MRIPRFVKIGPFRWKVRMNSEVAHESNSFGSCHWASQTIFLRPDNTKQKQEQTFVHEILHALIWHTGLMSRLDRIDKDLEEEIVENLAFGLYQIINENPKIFEKDS